MASSPASHREVLALAGERFYSTRKVNYCNQALAQIENWPALVGGVNLGYRDFYEAAQRTCR